MTSTKDLVFLLKCRTEADGSEDKFKQALKKKGFEVVHIETLDFKYKQLDLLRKCLGNPNDYSGLVFSSPRCVEAARLALNGDKLGAEWNDLDSYVVGESTFECALSKLGLISLGGESGNAVRLADIMLAHSKYHKPFLYPHGNLKMDILKDKLGETIKLHDICVYDTIPRTDIENSLALATSNFQHLPEFVIFFSPSGATAAGATFQKFNLVNTMKFVAIGPTTEARMKDMGIPLYSVATHPTPEDVVNALCP